MKKLYYISYDIIDSCGNWERRKTFCTFDRERYIKEKQRLTKYKSIIIIQDTETSDNK